jgi:hypothetical protein
MSFTDTPLLQELLVFLYLVFLYLVKTKCHLQELPPVFLYPVKNPKGLLTILLFSSLSSSPSLNHLCSRLPTICLPILTTILIRVLLSISPPLLGSKLVLHFNKELLLKFLHDFITDTPLKGAKEILMRDGEHRLRDLDEVSLLELGRVLDANILFSEEDAITALLGVEGRGIEGIAIVADDEHAETVVMDTIHGLKCLADVIHVQGILGRLNDKAEGVAILLGEGLETVKKWLLFILLVFVLILTEREQRHAVIT